MRLELASRQERAALTRIVAVLRALADFAELAVGRSPAVLGLLIFILRPAEAVARDFIVGDPDELFAPLPVGAADGGRAEAMRLAASFRALALTLEMQAAAMFVMQCGGLAGRRQFGSHSMAAMLTLVDAPALAAAAGWPAAHPAPDTS